MESFWKVVTIISTAGGFIGPIVATIIFTPIIQVDVAPIIHGNLTEAKITITNAGLTPATNLRITLNPQYNIINYTTQFYTEKIDYESTGPRNLIGHMERLANDQRLVIVTMLNTSGSELKIYNIFVNHDKGSTTYRIDTRSSLTKWVEGIAIPLALSTIGAGIAAIISQLIRRYYVKSGKTNSQSTNTNEIEPTKEDRKKHTQDLTREIYRKLLNIYLREDYRDHKLGFKIPQNYEEYEKNKIMNPLEYFQDDPMLMSIERLPKPYLEWGFKHLEEYEDIIKPWNESKKLLDDYNPKYEKFIISLEKKIKDEMKQSFPDFEAHDQSTTTTNRYYLKEIRRRSLNTFGSNMQNQEKSGFEDIIKDRNSILPTGFSAIPYVIGQKIIDQDVDKFRNVLISITTNSDLVKQFENLQYIRSKIGDEMIKFRDQLEILVNKLNAGMIIDGKCELGY